MQLIKQLPVLALSIVMASFSHAAAPMVLAGQAPLPSEMTVKVKSYREWKSEQVQEALIHVTTTKTQIQIAKSKDPNLAKRKGGLEAHSGAGIEKLEVQLQQDQATLELVKDLSVTDYFVGYLTKIQNKKAAFNEVAGKLTADEVAELMTAYANSVFGAHTPEISPSATDLSSDRVR